METPPIVVIGVITRNRAGCLDRWLEAVRREPSSAVGVVVVDSSDDDRSLDVVDRHRKLPGPPIDYVRRSGPGYSQARNALVSRCRHLGADWIALADDDDLPEPGWLEALVSAASAFGAEAVCGPALVRHPSAPEWWVRARSDDARLERGVATSTLWTSNALLSVAMLERIAPGGEPFSLRFDRGGEDVALAMRMRAAGVVPVWAPDAVVAMRDEADVGLLRPVLRRRYVGSQLFSYSERLELGFRPLRVATSVGRLAQGLALGGLASLGRDRNRRVAAAVVVACALGNLRGMARRRPPTWVSFPSAR